MAEVRVHPVVHSEVRGRPGAQLAAADRVAEPDAPLRQAAGPADAAGSAPSRAEAAIDGPGPADHAVEVQVGEAAAGAEPALTAGRRVR